MLLLVRASCPPAAMVAVVALVVPAALLRGRFWDTRAVPPALTVSVPPPRFCATSRPPLMVFPPVYVLAPVSTHLPAPFFATERRLPAPSASRPAIVLSPVLAPASVS